MTTEYVYTLTNGDCKQERNIMSPSLLYAKLALIRIIHTSNKTASNKTASIILNIEKYKFHNIKYFFLIKK